MDTSALQFYPALFVVATDVLDMLGDMVWQRIRQKAELSSDGNTICTLRGCISLKLISNQFVRVSFFYSS